MGEKHNNTAPTDHVLGLLRSTGSSISTAHAQRKPEHVWLKTHVRERFIFWGVHSNDRD